MSNPLLKPKNQADKDEQVKEVIKGQEDEKVSAELQIAMQELVGMAKTVTSIPDFTYTKGRLHQIILQDGTKFLPKDGFFTAISESQYKMLEDLAATGLYGIERIK